MTEFKIKVDIPKEFRKEFESALAKITEEFTRRLKLQVLRERLDSEEEKKVQKWSVKMGRKVKKDMAEKLKEKDLL